KLASIDESRQRYPAQKMGLTSILLDHARDRDRGVYVPLTSHQFLKAKLTEDFASVPTSIRADVGTTLCFFGNPLLLPNNFDICAFCCPAVFRSAATFRRSFQKHAEAFNRRVNRVLTTTKEEGEPTCLRRKIRSPGQRPRICSRRAHSTLKGKSRYD